MSSSDNRKESVNTSVTSTAVRKSTVQGANASAAFDGLMGSPRGKRFRLSDLSALIYPLTSPRSHPAAAERAGKLIREAAKAGRLKRHGHLHWEAVEICAGRKLLDGRVVPVVAEVRKLTLTTHCVGKWAAVDLETGEIYEGTPTGWKHAGSATRKTLSAAVAAAGKGCQE